MSAPSTSPESRRPAPASSSRLAEGFWRVSLIWTLVAAMLMLAILIDFADVYQAVTARSSPGGAIGGWAGPLGLWSSSVALVMLLGLGVLAFEIHRRHERERARWAEELAELRAANRLRGVVDVIPSMIWQAGATPECNHYNAAWLRFTGRTLTQELGEGWADGVHPDDREQCLSQYHAAFHARRSLRIEYRRRRHDGQYRWIIDEGTPSFDERGQFLGYIGSCVDVTELRESQIAHRELHSALTTAMEGIARLDAKGRYVSVNSAYAAALGRVPEELLGGSWEVSVDPADLPRVREAWRVMKESRKVEIEAQGRRADGSVFPKRVTMIAQHDSLGRFTGHYCLMKDLSDRDESVRLRLMTSRFETLADKSPVGIFYTDAAATLLYVNAAMRRFAGCSDEQSRREAWIAAVHPDDRERVERERQGLVAAVAEHRTELRFLAPDGRETWLYVLCAPVRESDGTLVGFIGSAVDITETKRAHGHLASALIIAEQQRQRESLLRRELDHRVRNNLAALRGLLTLYERTGRPGREVAEAMRGKFLALTEVHELIARSSRRGVRVDDIVARLVRALVPASRLADFRTQGDHTELPASQVGALAMILHELLANSLKHGGLADPAGRVSVEWSADPNGQGLSLVWRESGTAPQAVAGTGVGLGLIRGLARSELRGEAAIDFETAGLVCTLHASFDHVDRDTPSLASPAAPAEHPHPAELIMTAGRSEDPESDP